MKSQLKQSGQEIFLKAIELKSEQQLEFINNSCGNDSELVDYVNKLLIAHKSSDKYFDELEDSISSVQLNEIEDHLHRNSNFGNYQIIKVMKQGGMGVIFLAKRADGEFERTVVIKVLPIGLDFKQSQNQFAHEKEILASLVHPNIVQLYDSGISKSGQSYFVMELINGKTLLNYCNENTLNIDQRIELFLQVLEAVSFAHQHLVIHGDIKPSNIMVNNDKQIKLLDFGIAQLVNNADSDIQGYSLNYLTPEHKNKKKIITTTDIHQLGQLLFELITSIRPKEIRSDELTFPLLSEIWESYNNTHLAQLKNLYQTSKKSLKKYYKSDLEFILHKALALEPDQRYQSIQRFADDLNLYKNDYPITARTSTVNYRMSKYVKRNTVFVLSLTTLLFTSLVFSLITIKNNKKLALERDNALIIKNLITDVFSAADPSYKPGQELSATELLDNGLERIRARFTQHTDIEVDLLEQIAKTYQNLGEYQKAQMILEEVFAIKKEIHPNKQIILAKAMLLLGENSRLMSKNKLAKDWLEKSLTIFNQQPNKNIKYIASVKSKLGRVKVLLGSFSESEIILHEATQLTENIYGKQSLEYAQALNDLNSAYFRQGKYKQVQQLLTKTKKIRESLLSKTDGLILNTDYATNINNLGLAYYLQGNLEKGEKYFRQANQLREKIFTKPHPDQAQSLTNLGLLLNDRGKPEEALPYLLKALTVREQTLNKGHMRIHDAKNNLAMVYHETSQFQLAEDIYDDVLTSVIKERGEKHPQTLSIMTNRANTLMELKQFDLAEKLFKNSLEYRLEALPKDHLYLSYSYIGLSRAKAALGDLQLAESLINQALKIRQEKLPANSWLLGEALYVKAHISSLLNQINLDDLTKACEILLNTKGKNNFHTHKCLELLKSISQK
jgi:serine/threonine-protein kinase